MTDICEDLDEEATIVTMDLQARSNEFIIDMEMIDFVQESVTCGEDSLDIIFQEQDIVSCCQSNLGMG